MSTSDIYTSSESSPAGSIKDRRMSLSMTSNVEIDHGMIEKGIPQSQINLVRVKDIKEEVSLETPQYLSGWRLPAVAVAVCFGLFLATLEIFIVSTALVAITDDLHSFGRSSWIVSSYLLTYAGFLIIWAKISDIIGRRFCLQIAWVIFIIFSGACGAAQTTDQLIVFRAFQGVGGSGLFSLTFVVFAELVDQARYSLFAAFLSLTYTIAAVLGPLLGGAICDGTSWRWIFYINCPTGVVAMTLLHLSMPVGYPYSLIKEVGSSYTSLFSKTFLTRVDFLGTLFLFGSSAFLVTALEEGGTQYAWSSARAIVLLVLSGLFGVGFILWENYLCRRERPQEAVFPWQLMKYRVFMGALAIAFLTGATLTMATIQIPQRFQAVNNDSALEAGKRLLPFSVCVSVGTMIGNLLASRLRIPSVFVLLAGAIFQMTSAALMSFLPVIVSPKIYGYEALLGTGLGFNLGLLIQLTPDLIRGKDQSVAMGAVTQFRALGGVVGLSIGANVLNSHVKSSLAHLLSPEQLGGILESTEIIAKLPESLQFMIRKTFADGYNLQMKATIAFSATQILMLALMWEKKLRRVS
ncbi:MAG: hypothetical protein MMC33_008859 [Icmadophila ericetorum]|nr:hypothetical protein [Icmadophila ericetorum]